MSGRDADTYHSNPFLFNDGDGNGPSLSDVAAVRIRIEEGGEEFSADMPSGDFSLTGRLTRRIGSYTSGDEADVTNLPNPIEVAADYLVNGKFGARISPTRVDWPAMEVQSLYCQEAVVNTDTEVEDISAVVSIGPTSPEVKDSPDGWIIANFGVDIPDGSLAGRTLKVLTAGLEQSKVIAHNWSVTNIDVNTDNRFLAFRLFQRPRRHHRFHLRHHYRDPRFLGSW